MRTRCGAVLRRPRDRGAVAVEAAFALLGLLAVLLAASWCLLLVLGQLGLGEAARAAARVAARGESDQAVVSEAHRLVPAGSVDVGHRGDHVVVDVARTVSPPGLFARWGSVHLHAEATALLEQTP